MRASASREERGPTQGCIMEEAVAMGNPCSIQGDVPRHIWNAYQNCPSKGYKGEALAPSVPMPFG